jgi:RNA polymerase sigma-70 factor (ECF subfamily)
MEAANVGLVVPQPVERKHTAREWPSDQTRKVQVANTHYPFVWRSVRRLGVAPQATDDAVQQVFVLVLQKLASIEPGCERPFLFQTALRVALSVRRNYAQRREAMIGEGLEDIADPAQLPDAAAEQQERRMVLDELLDTLPTHLRTVFILFEIERLESAEISLTLGIPVGTVASRLRRARAIFREGAARLRKRLERSKAP